MSWQDLNCNAQQERLYLLLEEMAEATHVIGKILRHGYDSSHPDNPEVTNKELLEKELGDVQFAIDLLIETGDLSVAKIKDHKIEKIDRMAGCFHWKENWAYSFYM
jgi:NTP pyrophosphatase (non-canonical NTP hydrolase)